MAGSDETARLLGLLSHVRKGSMHVTIGPHTVLDLNSAEKTLTLDVSLVEGSGKGKVSIMNERRIGFWQALGFARSLSDSGWQLVLEKDGRNLVWMGRGVTALTGHIRADIGALMRTGELGRFL